MAIKATLVKTQTEHRNGRDVIVSIYKVDGCGPSPAKFLVTEERILEDCYARPMAQLDRLGKVATVLPMNWKPDGNARLIHIERAHNVARAIDECYRRDFDPLETARRARDLFYRKRARVYHFLVSRTPANLQFTVLSGSYDCQTALDKMQHLFETARDRGENIEYKCAASYDNKTGIADTVKTINEVYDPITIRESA
jgi:hypothetical protein